jgi:hypothetical protein
MTSDSKLADAAGRLQLGEKSVARLGFGHLT